MITKISKPIVLLLLLAITLCGLMDLSAFAAPNQVEESDDYWEYEVLPQCPLDDDELYESAPLFDDIAGATATTAQVPRTLTYNAGTGATWISVLAGWTRNEAQTRLRSCNNNVFGNA